MTFVNGMRVEVKKGCEGAGCRGVIMSSETITDYYGTKWSVVTWDDERDPVTFKTGQLQEEFADRKDNIRTLVKELVAIGAKFPVGGCLPAPELLVLEERRAFIEKALIEMLIK